MQKNFLRLDNWAILSVSYMYIDHQNYQADAIFKQDGIHIHFGKEFVQKNSKYCIVLCKVRRKDSEKFEKALEKLANKMLLLGYADYPNACSDIMELLNQEGSAA